MLYRPEKGVIWDASVIFHDGKYYMFSMYLPEGGDKQDSVWLAESDDGVHWKDVGVVIKSESRPVNIILAMRVLKCGDRFILNHGAFSRPGVNDTLSFWESKELRHWEFLYDSHPDPELYVPTARWDCMYMIPKDEQNLDEGYWGYLTAVPRREVEGKGHGFGMMQSKDGVHWESIPPPLFEFGDFPPYSFEIGGCERIGGKYYLLCGTPSYMGNWCYTIHTFVGESPTGPFRPDPEAFRLCGASKFPGRWAVQALASFARGGRDLLITNYLSNYDDGVWTVWLLPLRKAFVDEGGHLRLGYWEANDAAKGAAISLPLDRCKRVYPAPADEKPESEVKKPAPWTPCRLSVSETGVVLQPEARTATLEEQAVERQMLALLEHRFDLEKGVILEGSIQVNRTTHLHPCYTGFYIEEESGAGAAILLEVGHPKWRRSEIGRLAIGDTISFDCVDVTGPGCATLTGLENGKRHTFRLWVRKNMFELYVDDLYVQTFLAGKTTGLIGFFAQNGTATFGDIQAWEMDL